MGLIPSFGTWLLNGWLCIKNLRSTVVVVQVYIRSPGFSPSFKTAWLIYLLDFVCRCCCVCVVEFVVWACLLLWGVVFFIMLVVSFGLCFVCFVCTCLVLV